MRRYLFALVSILSLLLLTECSSDPKVIPWDLIDENTVLVFERAAAKNTSFQTQHDSADFYIANERVKKILSEQATDLLIALQHFGTNDFEILYLWSSNISGFENLLARLNKEFSGKRQRSLNGITIHESFDSKTKNGLSIAFINGTAVVSESPILVENCIRLMSNQQRVPFRSKNEKLFQFSFVREDAGNLYFNEKELYKAITLPKWFHKIPALKSVDNSSLLDVKSSSSSYLLNGFSTANDTVNKWSGVLQKLRPVPVQLTRFIPYASHYLVHFGISDFNALIRGQEMTVSSELVTMLGDEIAICDVPGNDDFAFVLELNEKSDSEKRQKYFDSNFTPFENYSTYEIKETLSSGSLGLLLNLFASIEPKVYCVVINDEIFASTSVASLKLIIDALEAEETWGRSVAFQKFFEKSLQESNYSLILKDAALNADGSTRLNSLLKSLGLDQLKWGSLQHSSLDDHFYTNINLEPGSSRKNDSDSGSEATELLMATSIRSFHVNQYPDGQEDILIEDENQQVHLFSNQNKALWKTKLESSIEGDVRMVDFYKNQKLQYFIPTSKKLYLIDRLGKNVSSFPMELISNASFSNVIDYDKSKNYRFLLAGDQHLYLFDKQKKSLEGWDPKKFGSAIQFTPEQHRIGGKDYFLILLKDGSVHLFNRRGEYQKGYPVSLNVKFAGDFFLDAGQSLSTSYLYFATHEGELGKLNLGDLKSEKQSLIKSTQAVFSLQRFSNQSSFAVLRTDPTKIAGFDRNAKLIFEASNPGSVSLQPQILALRNNIPLYSFFDSDQKISYLFDQSGKPFLPSSIECTLPLKLLTNKKTDRLTLYSANGNSLQKIDIN